MTCRNNEFEMMFNGLLLDHESTLSSIWRADLEAVTEEFRESEVVAGELEEVKMSLKMNQEVLDLERETLKDTKRLLVKEREKNQKLESESERSRDTWVQKEAKLTNRIQELTLRVQERKQRIQEMEVEAEKMRSGQEEAENDMDNLRNFLIGELGHYSNIRMVLRKYDYMKQTGYPMGSGF